MREWVELAAQVLLRLDRDRSGALPGGGCELCVSLCHQSLSVGEHAPALPRAFSGEVCYKQRTPLCLLSSNLLATGGAAYSFFFHQGGVLQCRSRAHPVDDSQPSPEAELKQFCH